MPMKKDFVAKPLAIAVLTGLHFSPIHLHAAERFIELQLDDQRQTIELEFSSGFRESVKMGSASSFSSWLGGVRDWQHAQEVQLEVTVAANPTLAERGSRLEFYSTELLVPGERLFATVLATQAPGTLTWSAKIPSTMLRMDSLDTIAVSEREKAVRIAVEPSNDEIPWFVNMTGQIAEAFYVDRDQTRSEKIELHVDGRIKAHGRELGPGTIESIIPANPSFLPRAGFLHLHWGSRNEDYFRLRDDFHQDLARNGNPTFEVTKLQIIQDPARLRFSVDGRPKLQGDAPHTVVDVEQAGDTLEIGIQPTAPIVSWQLESDGDFDLGNHPFRGKGNWEGNLIIESNRSFFQRRATITLSGLYNQDGTIVNGLYDGDKTIADQDFDEKQETSKLLLLQPGISPKARFLLQDPENLVSETNENIVISGAQQVGTIELNEQAAGLAWHLAVEDTWIQIRGTVEAPELTIAENTTNTPRTGTIKIMSGTIGSPDPRIADSITLVQNPSIQTSLPAEPINLKISHLRTGQVSISFFSPLGASWKLEASNDLQTWSEHKGQFEQRPDGHTAIIISDFDSNGTGYFRLSDAN